MTTRPKTLRELLEEGSLNLRTREDVDQNAERDDAAAVRWMQATRAETQAGPRKPGRPAADQPKRETKVRSVRLTIPVWVEIDAAAELEGCSANRFIEEAILSRLSCLNPRTFFGTASTDWATIPTIAMNDGFETRSKIVTFERPAA